MYGPIPIMDKNIPINASVDQMRVYRQPVDDVVNYIVSTIDQALPDLPTDVVGRELNELGRITRPAAMAIKARVLAVRSSLTFNNHHCFCQAITLGGHGDFSWTSGTDDSQCQTVVGFDIRRLERGVAGGIAVVGGDDFAWAADGERHEVFRPRHLRSTLVADGHGNIGKILSICRNARTVCLQGQSRRFTGGF